MTVKEFNEIIAKDDALQKKYEEAIKACKSEGVGDQFELLSKAAAKLGFDVPACQFKLETICKQGLNDDELEAVAGGRDNCRGVAPFANFAMDDDESGDGNGCHLPSAI